MRQFLGCSPPCLFEEKLDILREALHGIIFGLERLLEVRINTINWKNSFFRLEKVVEGGQYKPLMPHF